MGRLGRLVVVVGLAALVSGCVTAPRVVPATEPSPSLITRPPGVPFPPVPADPLLRSFNLERCTGLDGAFDIPDAWVRAAVPSAFTLTSIAPGTAGMAALLLSCERFVNGTGLVEHYQELLFAAITHAKNSSWEPHNGNSLYVFDHVASSPNVVSMLNLWGFPTVLGAFTGPSTPAPGITRWRVEFAGGAFELEYNEGDGTGPNAEYYAYYWTGDKQFEKLEESVQLAHHTYSGYGTITFEGSSQTAYVARLPACQVIGATLAQLSATRILNASVFEG